MEHPYPVNLDVSGKSAVVIGGGRVAARKIATLAHAGAAITVVSPSLDPRIDERSVAWVRRAYRAGDLAGQDIVIVCTDDPEVNHQVAQDASRGQLVNNVGNPADSNFSNVAVIESDDIVITVSSRGKSPARTRLMKQRLREWLSAQGLI
ncbi:MAG: bifunctional precorrin-2 dehydrogenase/sirohydrochlorin ferrochelatase [Bifidobacterium subtile]|jgi:precorrin-2 dehydrogenase/sirohydrochlorin ferrochelatase|nr:bifunctional precorrin-2 dehydrogenase/sirohydrochlorin ferrochelatase [Bifidobacterium subtile]MCI1241929.1 bifunctional precorrin-2 dehydrogenase/sirohydrochlorin ferrochelatase [Bifidobacterium subtile]MCI1258662.1 bifunctional precorrin-2 dehydrogenase/sirohydrochlorin ferrochelatase [Bifidobacterium subtile]